MDRPPAARLPPKSGLPIEVAALLLPMRMCVSWSSRTSARPATRLSKPWAYPTAWPFWVFHTRTEVRAGRGRCSPCVSVEDGETAVQWSSRTSTMHLLGSLSCAALSYTCFTRWIHSSNPAISVGRPFSTPNEGTHWRLEPPLAPQVSLLGQQYGEQYGGPLASKPTFVNSIADSRNGN